jgi:tRNA pseudouridine13 synthase
VPVPRSQRRTICGQPGLASAVERVLSKEGLTLKDLEAHILKEAYLSRMSRPLLPVPKDMTSLPAEPDELSPGRSRVTLRFTLPRGSYATLVLRILAHMAARDMPAAALRSVP